MFAVTPRLLLRPGWPEDAGAVFNAICDEMIVRNLARAPWPYRLEDARQFLALPVDERFPRWLIVSRVETDPQLIGTIGIDPMESGSVELGYWIARDQWGKGYATEAGHAAIECAELLGHRALQAAHFSDNPASGAVLRKLGFRPTGRMVKRYSLGRKGEADTVEFVRDVESGDDDLSDVMRPLAA